MYEVKGFKRGNCIILELHGEKTTIMKAFIKDSRITDILSGYSEKFPTLKEAKKRYFAILLTLSIHQVEVDVK